MLQTGTNSDGSQINEEYLTPPHFWYRTPDMVPLRTTDLEEFILKAEFVHCSIEMFAWFHSPKRRLTPEAQKAWPEIFSQPALYPPLDAHPLSPNYKEPGSPPQ